ncbi:hypothetical protein [Pseudoduganella chitinolytica]|uniref:Lipocalin-like domain-containing protein n=1 Tax=Pseudoduganella chitinolytica TaxID=34070 RepID=A0ABY8B731_9BURK|nr:hypothetical protein [Pseudoduganella chitinolytica]WEF30828.1 hypothetical protein PX653_15240 [Pseudoduganella chitinolytica]
MKNTLLSLVLCCTFGVAAAFPGTLDMTRRDGAIQRSLSVSNWTVDARGVPSFDFRFSQTGSGCDYRREGHAIAGFDINDGRVELQVYSGQDEHGREGPQLLLLYANANEVAFTMPFKQNKMTWIAFDDERMSTAVAKKCGYTERGSSSIRFQK